ncbi:hypothetical protein HO133_006910 [Letharia lupina]|uniref:Uncharacterized protein n=1 Tax=Letharia lupina TaxID=560253 RepID=A0A8H6C452_9LECA|nr:uncharacterized protein HO133_006910 [Letharia lupina]KAF6217440.1 hypothetical protein HO133_006910 [Letharia lupina]
MAATPPSSGSTTSGTGQLNLLTPQNLSTISLGRATYCKHDDDDPFHFTSSLNNTFPSTPAIPESYLESAGLTTNQETYPFDCFLELPGGVVVFEIKGELDSELTLVFQVWISVLVFNYDEGIYRCNLLEVDKHSCSFTIDKKYINGQAGLFPRDDPDPNFVDLCFEVHGTVKIPYTRVNRRIDFGKCFFKFPKPKTIDADA